MMRDPFDSVPPPQVPHLETPRACAVVRRAVHEVPPRISVVVPNYNTAGYVVTAVRSILAQSVAELEVIVVDDGSTDNSVQDLLNIDAAHMTIVSQANRGLAGARNTGIAIARAPLIGFCDSDDVWHPRKAERHLAVMKDAAEIGVTFSFSAYLRDDGTPTGQLLRTKCAEAGVRQLLRRNHLGNGSTAVVRRSCFEHVGLFDESMTNVEEWELWLRIAACTPLRIVRIAEPLTGYRIRAGSLSVSYQNFLQNAWTAIQRFRTYVPGFTPRMAQRAYAEALRIASRKSFEAGDIHASRRFLLEAAHRSPDMFMRDSRAFAMAAFHLATVVLPRAAATLPYRASDRVRGAFAARALAEWGWVGGRA